MSDWRLDLIQGSFEAFTAPLNPEGAIAVYHPDCVWDVGQDIGTVFGQQEFHGHEGLRELFQKIGEVFADWTPAVEELRETEGGAILLRGAGGAHSEQSEVGLRMPDYGQVIGFREKLIHRVEQTEFPPPGWDDAKPID